MPEAEPVPLGTTGWHLWPDGLLRGTGFPATGLQLLSGQDGSAAVDAAVSRGLDNAEAAADPAVLAALAADEHRASDAVDRIAADPLFLEAVTWQNPQFAGIAARLPGSSMNNKRRRRERQVARYWQRYCGKNDTIGFFGPVCWVRLEPDQPEAVRVRPGPNLVRDRHVEFEYWALERFVDALLSDSRIAPRLPVGRAPQLAVDPVSGAPRGPGAPSEAGPQLRALLACADGRAAEAVLAAASRTVAVTDDDLRAAVDAGVLWWGADLPYNSSAERSLVELIDALPDAARRAAQQRWDQMSAARDEVAAAAGDPIAVAAALAGLAEVFTSITGAAPHRRDGQMYAGRLVCFEDTLRDIDITIGVPVIESLAEPLSVLLPAARWLSVATAEPSHRAFAELFEHVRDSRDVVPLSEFWDAAREMLDDSAHPVYEVARDFARRWRELFGLDDVDPAEPVLRRSADLAPSLQRLFPADAPAWPGARIHSPDVQICAAGADQLARGEFSLVLGELHAVWPTFDSGFFLDLHPDVSALRLAAERDYGPQVRPLYPTDWPQYTARIAPMLGGQDVQFAFTGAPGADPSRLMPIGAYEVGVVAGELRVVLAEGFDGPVESVTVDELFTLFIAWMTSVAFKLGLGGAHSPRVTLDRMVVEREAWRTSAGELAWAAANGAVRFVGARRWRSELGLPERVYVSVGTETKPVFVDFTSALLVSSLAAMVENALIVGGPDVAVTITEMLPTIEQAWLPDIEGRRYFSELRLQVRDPEPAVRPRILPRRERASPP